MSSDRSWERRFSPSWHDRRTEVVLAIGSDTFTRREIGTLLISPDLKAAGILNKVLRKYDPKNVEELAKRLTVDELFGTPGVGQSTLGVWLDVLSYKEIDVEEWLNNKLTVPQMYNEARIQRKSRLR